MTNRQQAALALFVLVGCALLLHEDWHIYLASLVVLVGTMPDKPKPPRKAKP